MPGETVVAVRDVSLAVTPGEFVALMGPSGSGKSTLLQLLGGLDRPTSGEVILEGEDISRLSDDQATRLRRERTGFVFQSFNLIPLLDVVENVGLPFTIAGHDPRSGDVAARIRDAIKLVDLTGKERHKPEQLSAGEQQRVAVARAIVTRPALLFADEPTGNLDFRTGQDILDALWRTCVERGQTIVLVTHDAKAAAYADRVLVIGDGTDQGRDRARTSRGSRRGAAHHASRAAGSLAASHARLRPVCLARAGRPSGPEPPDHLRDRDRRCRAGGSPRHERRTGRIDRADRLVHGGPSRPAGRRVCRDRTV